MASPTARVGDSTPWYASFWEFCARYSAERFGDEWHLSAEEVALAARRKTVVPEQIVVCSPKGTNHLINLLHGTSLYDLKVPGMPPAENLVMRDGLRLCSTAASLVGVGEIFFARNPVESPVVLEPSATNRTFHGSCSTAATRQRRVISAGHSAASGAPNRRTRLSAR